jgi:hypothetical protein
MTTLGVSTPARVLSWRLRQTVAVVVLHSVVRPEMFTEKASNRERRDRCQISLGDVKAFGALPLRHSFVNSDLFLILPSDWRPDRIAGARIDVLAYVDCVDRRLLAGYAVVTSELSCPSVRKQRFHSSGFRDLADPPTRTPDISSCLRRVELLPSADQDQAPRIA